MHQLLTENLSNPALLFFILSIVAVYLKGNPGLYLPTALAFTFPATIGMPVCFMTADITHV